MLIWNIVTAKFILPQNVGIILNNWKQTNIQYLVKINIAYLSFFQIPHIHIWERHWEIIEVVRMARESRIEGQRQFNGGWAVKLTLRLSSPSASTFTLSPFDNSSYPGRTKALSRPQWPISSFPITCPLRKTVEKEDTEPFLQSQPKSLLTL